MRWGIWKLSAGEPRDLIKLRETFLNMEYDWDPQCPAQKWKNIEDTKLIWNM